MSQTERLFKIEQLIRARGLVPFATLLDELAVSRATLKRDLTYLRDLRTWAGQYTLGRRRAGFASSCA